MILKFSTSSEADTLRFAGALATSLMSGDTILLHGDLGVGKSVLARGIARALGIQGPMPSPTFTLMIPYEGKMPLRHYDLYRLNDPDEFYEAGLDEGLGAEGISLIEWPEMAELEISDALELELSRTADENGRRIELLAPEGRSFPGTEAWRTEE